MNVFTRSGAAVAAVLIALAVGASCDKAPPGSLLTPTGGAGAAFVSAYTAIQIVGDFNGFDAGVTPMSLDESGVWADTLTVQAGCYLMKLRTNEDWDETPDFGRCSGSEDSCQVQVPDDGTVLTEQVCAVTGTGTAIGQVEFLVTGSYLFEFDEPQEAYRISRLSEVGSISGVIAFSAPRGAARLPEATVTVFEAGTQSAVTTTTSDAATGAFRVEGLAPGAYDVQIQAQGYQAETVTGVQVVALADTDIGTVTLVVGCSYFYTAIQALGEFNNWDVNTPSMVQIGNCVWADTLNLAVGCYYMKFRTDMNWDSPPDFGRCTGSETICEIPIPTDGTAWADSVCEAAPGADAIGQIQILAPGDYVFLFDESGPSYSIRSLTQISTGSVSGSVAFSDMPGTSPVVTVTVFQAGTTTQVTSTTSDPATDTFSVGNLLSGSYDLTFEAAGYLVASRTAVTVNAPADTPLGTITLMTGGSLSGTVGFSDTPGTSPTVDITVFQAGTTTQVATGQSDPMADTFLIETLATGSYDVLFQAVNYADTTVTGVSVTAPNDTDMGTVTLEKQCASSFTTISVLFVSGPPFPSTTALTQVQPCVWTATIALPVGCSSLSFPTNAALSYLRCTGAEGICQSPIPTDGTAFTRTVCAQQFGAFIGEIEILTAGNYELTVDEGAAPANEAVLSIRKVP
jgi:hypothetical protein